MASPYCAYNALPGGLGALSTGANLYPFSEGTSGQTINDGGSDMYDNGNYLRIQTSSGYSGYLYYTNTNAFRSAGIGDVQYYTYKQTGAVTAFVAEFTSASSGITGFVINGDNGADGGGYQAYGNYDRRTWTGLPNGWSSAFKQVYNAYDPSINHLIVAPGPIASQRIGSSTNDDRHELTFSSGVSKVVYVLWAGNSGYHFSDAYFKSVAEALSSGCSPY